MFARQATFDMRTTWAEKMRTAPRTNMPIHCPPDKKSDWEHNAEVKIQNGIDLLMHKINGFVSGAPNTKKETTASHVPSFQEIFDSRTAQERQKVREREL